MVPRRMGSYAGYLLETFFTLVVVCVVAVAVLYGARRLGIGRASGSIKLVGQLPLDARRAIGAQNVPSNTVVMALAAALTVLAMEPVGEKIWTKAEPLFTANKALDTGTLVSGGIDAVKEPMRDFLKANSDAKERSRFV